jgi:hypothetical protein
MHLLCHLACIVIVHCMLYMGSERMAYSLASGDCSLWSHMFVISIVSCVAYMSYVFVCAMWCECRVVTVFASCGGAHCLSLGESSPVKAYLTILHYQPSPMALPPSFF